MIFMELAYKNRYMVVLYDFSKVDLGKPIIFSIKVRANYEGIIS